MKTVLKPVICAHTRPTALGGEQIWESGPPQGGEKNRKKTGPRPGASLKQTGKKSAKKNASENRRFLLLKKKTRFYHFFAQS